MLCSGLKRGNSAGVKGVLQSFPQPNLTWRGFWRGHKPNYLRNKIGSPFKYCGGGTGVTENLKNPLAAAQSQAQISGKLPVVSYI